MYDRATLKEGMHVKSADGHSLGKVVRLDADTFIIEKGLFFPKDYVARYDRISEVKDGEIILLTRGEELKGREEKKEYKTGAYREEATVPLAEEELTATKHTRQAGEVRVEKHVETEQKHISVPVTHEEVRVERVAASEESKRRGEPSFKEGVTTIPIREEEVEVTKRPVVKEEIRVTKEVRPEERRYSVETRKEKAEIKESGDVRKYDEPKK